MLTNIKKLVSSKESFASTMLALCFVLFSSGTYDPVLHIRFIYLWAVVAISCLALWFVKNNKSAVSLNWTHLTAIAFAVSGTFACTFSPVPFDGIFVTLKLWLLAAVFILLNNADLEYDIFFASLARRLAAILAIACGVGVFQLASIDFQAASLHHELYTVKSLFAHKNIFTEILVLLFPFTIYSIITDNKKWKLFAGITALITSLLIVVLVSRTAWLAFAISLMGGFALYFFFGQKNSKNRQIARNAGFVLIGIVTVAIVVFSALGYGELLVKQATNFINVRYGSALDRFYLWGKTFSVFDSGWIFGNGMESWKIEMLSAGSEGLKSVDETTFYQRPHNDFIWVLFEQGIVGLLLYGSLFLLAGFRLILSMKTAPHNWQNFILSSVLIGFGVISLFAFPKERIEHTIILAIVFAFSAKDLKPRISVSSKPVFVIILGISLASIFIGSKRLSADKNLMTAMSFRQTGNWMKTVEYADKAHSPFFKLDLTSTPIDWYRGEAWYYMNRLDKAFIYFNQAYKLNPYHIHNTNNLATCYYKKGNYTKAIELYKEALQINPQFTESLFNISSVLYNNKNYIEGYQYFRSIADSINPERYQKVAGAYLPKILSYEKTEAKKINVKDAIQRISNSWNWAYTIHQKSVENNITFRKQLYLDIAYALYSDTLITLEEKINIEELGDETDPARANFLDRQEHD